MNRIDEIEERLNNTLGGDWHTEESPSVWQLFAKNHVKLESEDEFELHPFQIAACTKNGYYPNEKDSEFLSHVKQDMAYLIERVRNLEAAVAQ